MFEPSARKIRGFDVLVDDVDAVGVCTAPLWDDRVMVILGTANGRAEGFLSVTLNSTPGRRRRVSRSSARE